jgi:hypothetical protein
LSAILGTVVTALFIPSIVGWFKSKRNVRKLNYYHKQIAPLYGDGKLDESNIKKLDHLKNKIGDAYTEGKLNGKHYETLRAETSTLYEDIFRKRIDSLNGTSSSKRPSEEQLARIRNEVEYAFSKGKINEKHYDNLKNEISLCYDKIFRKRIKDSSNNNSSLIKRNTQEQLAQIQNDIEYAYSEGKINEKHYDLLTKAISTLNSKDTPSQ